MQYLTYLKNVMRHKWFVFLACFKVGGVSLWQAVFHDWDKFLPSMFIAYANFFYGNYPSQKDLPLDAKYICYTKEQAKEAFAKAWNAHQKRNKHHWQYWLITWDKGNTDPLEMPMCHLREMVADWMGAGRAYGNPNTLEWYEKNKEVIQLHPETRRIVEHHLRLQFDENYKALY